MLDPIRKISGDINLFEYTEFKNKLFQYIKNIVTKETMLSFL